MPTVPEIVTENIIKQLEQGVAPWRKPWSYVDASQFDLEEASQMCDRW